eukprot:CAMPEP_0115676336 /NCGR_PEP_ID=MMETSP0272-20121206/54635_1 /TAXON_ID=71861 /ORGANISM="Scrippsiella trochoidea, Strain CCMP3099" /LENGTH=309 /DNA_ID=CAMNT_0003115375 /DNA_START=95 /DNA_END=1024 /DNA_ORIENTATION=+
MPVDSDYKANAIHHRHALGYSGVASAVDRSCSAMQLAQSSSSSDDDKTCLLIIIILQDLLQSVLQQSTGTADREGVDLVSPRVAWLCEAPSRCLDAKLLVQVRPAEWASALSAKPLHQALAVERVATTSAVPCRLLWLSLRNERLIVRVTLLQAYGTSLARWGVVKRPRNQAAEHRLGLAYHNVPTLGCDPAVAAKASCASKSFLRIAATNAQLTAVQPQATVPKTKSSSTSDQIPGTSSRHSPGQVVRMKAPQAAHPTANGPTKFPEPDEQNLPRAHKVPEHAYNCITESVSVLSRSHALKFRQSKPE